MVALIIILLTLSAAGVGIGERRLRRRGELQRHYLESILLSTAEGERYLDQLSLLSNSTTKRIAAEVIASLSTIIYRLESEQLLRISYSLHLPEFLLKEAAKSQGAERARIIALFSQIPSTHITPMQLEQFARDSNRMVRFFTLLSTINIDKPNMLRHIAAYPSPLTPFELSGLLNLLRRGTITVAYQPLLGSTNQNLNMLGLAVVREFEIVAAEDMLRTIIERYHVDLIRLEALYTLCTLHLSLSNPTIVSYIRHLPHTQRRRLLRFITAQGYCQGVIDLLSSHSEREYFHSLIDSYKIKIECY